MINYFYTGPIFLHFLNRELLRSLDINNINSIEKALKLVTLSSSGKLFSGISLLWESYEYTKKSYFLLSKLIEHQHLELTSDTPTLDEFIASRQELYKFDHLRYPMYFRHQENLQSFRPTAYKGSSATKALFNEIVLWGNSDSKSVSFFDEHEVNALSSIRDIILSQTLNKEEKAITLSLYELPLYKANIKPSIKHIIARFLSSLYLIHFKDYLGGDIITGIPGLEYYDRFSNNYPLLDIGVQEFILSRMGYKTFLQEDRNNIIEFVITVRGTAEQMELSRLLHLLISGIHFTLQFRPKKAYSLPSKIKFHSRMKEILGSIFYKDISIRDNDISFIEMGIINLNRMIELCRKNYLFDIFMNNYNLDEHNINLELSKHLSTHFSSIIQDKELFMSEPISAAFALSVVQKLTDFLFGQANEMLKNWREKKKTDSTALAAKSKEDNTISEPETIKIIIAQNLSEIEKLARTASYEIKVKEANALILQAQELYKNRLMYEDEEVKLPNIDDRVAIRRRIDDIDSFIAQKTHKMKNILEELANSKIHVPALDD